MNTLRRMRFSTAALVAVLFITGTFAQLPSADNAPAPTALDPCKSCSVCNGNHMQCDKCYTDSIAPLCADCHNWCTQCEPCGLFFQIKMACAESCSDDCMGICSQAPITQQECGLDSPCAGCGSEVINFYSGSNQTCNEHCGKCYSFENNESCDECVEPCDHCRQAGCVKCLGWSPCNICQVPSPPAPDAAGMAALLATQSAATVEGSSGTIVGMLGVMAMGGVAAALYLYKRRQNGALSVEARAVSHKTTSEGTTYGSVPAADEAEIMASPVSTNDL